MPGYLVRWRPRCSRLSSLTLGTGGATASTALVQSCLTTDGFQAITTADGQPGYATCWQDPFLT